MFNAEIQDGPPKMAGKWVKNGGKVGQKFLRNRSISLCYQDKHVLAFNTEIQDGHQKWQEKEFCEKSPVNFPDTLWVKNCIEIAPSRSVSKINAFLRLTQKFKMAAKSGRKHFLRSFQLTLQIPCGSKNCVKITLSHSVSKISAFLRSQKFKVAAKSGGKIIFAKLAGRLCRHPEGQKFP